jgi:A/G-specific adenine glycosylase
LARADQGDVIGFWSSHRLGYNNRARYLHETAEIIESEYNGAIPQSPEELETLPGVGPYTANAVASFAFNTGNAVVDTNVKRVLYRAFSIPDSPQPFETTANELLPPDNSRKWNNAIMELGAVACQKAPECDQQECPWRTWCDAYASGDFTAPDVPEQPSFEGSRRQYRGRIIRVLQSNGPTNLTDLGHRIRVDYTAKNRDWLKSIVSDLADDDLITVNTEQNETIISLQRSS